MNILVCGTNYGASYLRALSFGDEELKIAGILSTGSERSRSYAASLNIPHYTSISEIPEGSIDIACVAVAGEAGSELSQALLNQGIHVIAEHPIDAKQMQTALELAQSKELVFQVNAHFADLQAPQAFFQAMNTARQMSSPLHYSLSVNLRTLYSGLDLLGRGNGSLQGAKVQVLGENKPELFKQLTIQLDDVCVALLCQNFSSEHDDGSANLINHRLDAVFGHGNLLLAETNGPVFWFPSPTSMPPESWKSSLPVDMSNLSSMELTQQRDYANLVTLKSMAAVIRGELPPIHQQPSYLQALAQLWQDCLTELSKGNQ
jgi:thiazolinyl imide reductase